MKEPIITTKTFLILIALILAAFVLSFFVRTPTQVITGPAQAIDQSITITGSMTCLPHADPSAVVTLECAYGIRSEDGLYYALDLTQSAVSVESIAFDQPITLRGRFTPLAALSNDQWYKYAIEGIVRVETLEQL